MSSLANKMAKEAAQREKDEAIKFAQSMIEENKKFLRPCKMVLYSFEFVRMRNKPL
jgi:hypothetical protein